MDQSSNPQHAMTALPSGTPNAMPATQVTATQALPVAPATQTIATAPATQATRTPKPLARANALPMLPRPLESAATEIESTEEQTRTASPDEQQLLFQQILAAQPQQQPPNQPATQPQPQLRRARPLGPAPQQHFGAVRVCADPALLAGEAAYARERDHALLVGAAAGPRAANPAGGASPAQQADLAREAELARRAEAEAALARQRAARTAREIEASRRTFVKYRSVLAETHSRLRSFEQSMCAGAGGAGQAGGSGQAGAGARGRGSGGARAGRAKRAQAATGGGKRGGKPEETRAPARKAAQAKERERKKGAGAPLSKRSRARAETRSSSRPATRSSSRIATRSSERIAKRASARLAAAMDVDSETSELTELTDSEDEGAPAGPPGRFAGPRLVAAAANNDVNHNNNNNIDRAAMGSNAANTAAANDTDTDTAMDTAPDDDDDVRTEPDEDIYMELAVGPGAFAGQNPGQGQAREASGSSSRHLSWKGYVNLDHLQDEGLKPHVTFPPDWARAKAEPLRPCATERFF
ncbi:hypothetical protein HDZ31DRAFT_76043 [Schizophyllum fasciatum]